MSKQKQAKTLLFISVFFFSCLVNSLGPKVQAATIRSIVFPVIGENHYSNDFNAPRDGGNRVHHAIDIIASKRRPLVSAVNGTIVDVQYPEPSWGYSVTIEDSAGYKYRYIHMNDDNPETNDGEGGGMNAYAVDVKEGNRVVRGQLIGRVGDSGNSNGVSHLHFEMFAPNDSVINPYESLNRATKISKPKNYPQLPNELLPSGTNFKSRISLDMGNFDLDPASEIVTSTGSGGSYVKVFETDGTQKARFAPNGVNFKGGSDVAAGDVDADGTDEIITGAGPGGGPHVAIWEPDGTGVDDFYPYSRDFRGGVRVSAGNIRTDTLKAEIITVPASKGSPIIRMYSGTGSFLGSFFFMEEWWKGYHDVAAAEGTSMSATGVNRRDSIRSGIE